MTEALVYRTSPAVKSAISQAYSGYFNPRGLEGYWYAVYLHTFSELATPYDGRLIANCQYPLYVTTLRMRELLLREEFEVEGLPFDSDDENYDDLTQKDLGDDDSDHGDILAGLQLDTPSNDQNRRSARVAEAKEKQEEAESLKGKKRKAELMKKKKRLIKDMNDYDGDITSNPDESQASIASVPEPIAKNMIPDFVLCHMRFNELPMPKNPQEIGHYRHRSGVKVSHRCCALIAELKQAPPRAFRELQMFDHESISLLDNAQHEALKYCSAYFANFKADQSHGSVIAFAGAGPFWQWAKIHPGDVEDLYDLISQVEKEGKTQRVTRKKLSKKFQNTPFILGTGESDEELTRISRDHIYPLLNL